jgi:glyoxylase-like metal-dependent hydrolase (beta-lactamase superfamily II)
MATKLRDDVWLIDLGGVNAYLVYDVADPDLLAEREATAAESVAADGAGGDREGVLTLVDAGMPFHARAVSDAIADAGFRVRDVERVLVTHYDVDHVGGLARLGLRDATVYMGLPDADFLTRRDRPALVFPMGLLRRLTWPLVSRPDLRVEPVADGDAVGSFTVYETPGHSPGHVAYVSEALSAAFVGDMVYERDGKFHAPEWYRSEDAGAVRESIHDFADRAPAVEVAGPGHGVPFMRGGSVRLAECGERIE